MVALSGPTIDVIIGGRDPMRQPSIIAALSTMIFAAVMFSSQGMISQPRKLGYYRLLFAKPVSPILYYVQLFVVNLLCAAALTAVIASIFGAIVGDVHVLAVAGLTAMAFILLGGVGFFASAIFNYDAVGVFGYFAFSVIAKGLAGRYTGLGPIAANLLMPTDHLLSLRRGLTPHGEFAIGDVAWVLAYGLAFFTFGCAALRYRQLAD